MKLLMMAVWENKRCAWGEEKGTLVYSWLNINYSSHMELSAQKKKNFWPICNTPGFFLE